MKLHMIKEGTEKNEIKYDDPDSVSELPEIIYRKVTRKVNDGAKDYKQEWDDPLKLLDWALEELNINKPSSVSSPRWKQYKLLIAEATKALQKARNYLGDTAKQDFRRIIDEL